MKTMIRTKKTLRTAGAAITDLSAKLADQVPARLTKTRKALGGLADDGVRMAKKHPVRAALGAFAVGVAVSRLARR